MDQLSTLLDVKGITPKMLEEVLAEPLMVALASDVAANPNTAELGQFSRLLAGNETSQATITKAAMASLLELVKPVQREKLLEAIGGITEAAATLCSLQCLAMYQGYLIARRQLEAFSAATRDWE